MRVDSDRWVVSHQRVAGSAAARLICFPCAGGSPDTFRGWPAELGGDVELLAVRLPGGGRRIAEPPYRCWPTLVEETFEALAGYLREPHHLYGHSFGARLAYEVTRLAATRFVGCTRGLFVHGCRSPDWPQRRPYMHLLPDEDFRDVVRAMGGTPSELLDNEAMMRLLLPVVRGEIRLAELWGNWHTGRVDVPITALCGREDRMESRRSMANWQAVTSGGFELVELSGGHFVPDSDIGDLVAALRARLGAGR